MNLYSQKPNGSIEKVEAETIIAPKKKRQSKKDKVEFKEVETKEIVESVLQDSTQDDQKDESVDESDSVSSTIEESETVPEPPKEVDLEPVESKKRKRKPKVSKIDPEPTPVEPVKTVDDDQSPPTWFLKYVQNMKSFQNEVAEKKRPKKIVKTEADHYAKEQWNKPEVRQKVTNTVDAHLSKMYRQIFSR